MEELILAPNTEYKINSLDDKSVIAQRLIQMGVLPGSIIRIVRTGPLGKTVEAIIDQGESIALRTDQLKALDCQLVALPLSAVKDFKKSYRIRNFLGGRGFLMKMQNLNLKISTAIKIIKNDGRKLIRVNGHEIWLGRGEAEKIIVEPIEE